MTIHGEAPTSEWLPISAGRVQIPNGDFATDISGWSLNTSVAPSWALQGKFGSGPGSGTNEFGHPAQVAVDSAGNTYTADGFNGRVVKRGPSGTYLSAITGLSAPVGVAVDSSGNIYVSTQGDKNVRKFNSSFVQQWAVPHTPESSFTMGHLTTDGTNLLMTIARPTYGVYNYRCSDGVVQSTYGNGGGGIGWTFTTAAAFNAPRGIALSGTNFYVADAGNLLVKKFTLGSATLATSWAINANAGGLAADPSGRVWVAEPGQNQLRRFSNTGTQQQLITHVVPDGVAAPTDTTLWVTSPLDHTLALISEGTFAATHAWDGTLGGVANGSDKVTVTSGTAGGKGAVYLAPWLPLLGAETVDVAAWVRTSTVNLIPRLQLSFADANQTLMTTETEPGWVPTANAGDRRVFAARVPDRAYYYRPEVAIFVALVGGTITGTVNLDDLTTNDAELIITDVNMGQLEVTVELLGRWI